MPIPNQKTRPRLARRAVRRDEAGLGKPPGLSGVKERPADRIFNLNNRYDQGTC
jgi:hypothetical protein